MKDDCNGNQRIKYHTVNDVARPVGGMCTVGTMVFIVAALGNKTY